MSIWKENCFHRFIALVLVLASLLTNLPMGVSAETDAEQTVYCGQADHTHTDACFVAPLSDSPTEAATEPTEVTTEPTAAATEPTEAATEPTEETEAQLTEYELLMASATVEELYALLYEQGYISALEGMSAEELAALDTHVDQIYDPEQDDPELYEMIKDGIGTFTGAYEDNGVAVLVDQQGTVAGGIIPTDTTWKLVGDVTLTGEITINNGATLTIDLNGYMIKREHSARFAYVQSGGTLVIKDSDSSTVRYGTITDDGLWQHTPNATTGVAIHGGIIYGYGWNCNGNGDAIVVQGGCTLELQGGTITSFGVDGKNGGALYAEPNGLIKMTGGAVRNNKAGYGGAVFVRADPGNPGKFEMTGGSIHDNQSSICGGALYIQANGLFEMTGGEIYQNKTKSLGGGVYSQGTIKMTGGSIRNNETEAHGGGICTEGTLTFSGGSIKGNTAKKAAAGVYASKGTFTMTGGEICDNKATTNGGALYAEADCAFSISNGEIRNNSATSGGGIYAKGTFNMTGGNIWKNKSTEHGAGITTEGTFTFSGGSITENEATKSAGGVHVPSGTFNMTGGEIWQNRAGAHGGAIYLGPSATFSVSDGAIHNNTTKEDGGAVCAEGTVDATGGEIYNNSTQGNGGAFHIRNVGKLSLKNCKIYGNTAGKNGGGIYAAGPVELTDIAIYENGSTIDGGGIYSEGTVDATGVEIYNNSTQGNGGAFHIYNVGKLSLKNCKIYGNTAKNGGGIYSTGTVELTNIEIYENRSTVDGGGIYSEGAVDLHSGSIYNNHTQKSSDSSAQDGKPEYVNCGGGICLKTSTGILTMDDGKIYGNCAASGSGVMLWENATFIMHNGTISGNYAYGTGGFGNGGAVYVNRNATFTMNNGVLEDNWARRYGGAVNINRGATLSLNGECVIRNNSANSGGGLSQEIDECTMTLNSTGIEITGNTARGESATEYASGAGGGIFIEEGTLTINAGTISGNHAYNAANVENGGIGGGIALHVKRQPGDITFIMNGGTISNNDAYSSGGGINLFADHITEGDDTNDIRVYLYGGTLSDNKSTNGRGGAINVGVNASNGTAMMEIGGDDEKTLLITRNTAATDGGAIHMSNGTVNMHSGTASWNTAASNGGAIAVQSGSFTMSGGSIIDNTASQNGGGIAVNDGQIIISGGSVSNNTAQTGSGGGVYISAPIGKTVGVKVFSGELSDNTAAVSGGAVGVQGLEGSTLNVQIGVNENHYTGEKGTLEYGFTHDEGEYIHLACPVVKNNQAKVSGGAFYIGAASNSTTNLNIYCSVDDGNSIEQDIDPIQNNKPLSSYLMVQGGIVHISTSEENGLKDGYTKPDDDVYGNIKVNGTVHVVSGQLELFGSMDNPAFADYLTIDLQKAEDKYVDHRISDSKVKISYHENFVDADGKPDSTQTAFDLSSDSELFIETGLYAHDGYVLYGWNTKPDADPTTEDGWYIPGTEITFYNPADPKAQGLQEGLNPGNIYCGDLTLYAIWKVQGYTIAFDPGVPAGAVWSGSISSISCSYVQKVNLPDNTVEGNRFVYPGYMFTGWKLGDTDYAPGQEVSKLTAKNAEVVTFVAQWVECKHEGECAYTINDAQDTITKTCTVCQLSATAKLTVQDAVYDTKEHPAILECSNATFWNPAVAYTGTKIGKTEDVLNPEMCINAGNYTATITGGDVTATATFTIAKADQAAPDEVPTYVRPTAAPYNLEVNQIASLKRYSNVPVQENEVKPAAEYIVRYYSGTEAVDTVYPGNDSDKPIVHTLDAALTTYSVYVRYASTDNYNESEKVSAKASFYFSDTLILVIEADEGIDYATLHTEGSVGTETSLVLNVSLQEGYYLLNTDGDADDFDVKGDAVADQYLEIELAEQQSKNHKYTIVAKNLPSEKIVAKVTVGTTKKTASIISAVAEKEHFSNFTADTSPIIARDSAFTVRFDVTGYDSSDYAAPVLEFNQTLAKGTTIILRDRTDESYWYYKVTGNTSEIPLTGESGFKRMGATGGSYTVQNGDLRLQFVVDFSGAESYLSGSELECNLSVDKISENSDVADLAAVAESKVKVGLSGVSSQMDVKEGQILTVDINIGAAASKYDHRDLALVLEPMADTVLPIDAGIALKMGDDNVTYRPNGSGKIIIPLGDFRSIDTEIALQLVSNMFPIETSTYQLTATLYLSQSNAEAAPLNGSKLDKSVTLTFTSQWEDTGIRVWEANDQRIFTVGSTITVNVNTDPEELSNKYEIAVQLYEEQDGVYVDTVVPTTENGNAFTFNLGGLRSGNYCIIATLKNTSDYVVAETKYYFILKPAEQ